ncbi:hypothetical protein UPYG_G00303480 [Umbra pygmaea]|uniref:C-type lectin domain-containing protein n=1 Tax=Umbra pygmaea TaxID=75934 RepID=A0ABD0WNB1_UMBPY
MSVGNYRLTKRHVLFSPEGQWKWLDRTVLDFTNWADGQPSDYSRNSEYGMMLTSDGTWSSGSAWHDKPYICKKPKALVLPETPPTKAVHLKADQKRVRYGLAVVVVLAALCLMGLTVRTLYKKTGRAPSADPSFSNFLVFRKPLFSAALKAFDNPVYVEPVTTSDMVNTNMVDTSQLVENIEEEPQTMS